MYILMLKYFGFDKNLWHINMFVTIRIMEEILYIDVASLRKTAKYFNLFVKPICKGCSTLILPKYIDIFVPDIDILSNCKLFINVISEEEEPYLPKLMETKIHVKTIFILTDFFCVDVILNEIQELYGSNLSVAPAFLKYFVEYYSIYHPR